MTIDIKYTPSTTPAYRYRKCYLYTEHDYVTALGFYRLTLEEVAAL